VRTEKERNTMASVDYNTPRPKKIEEKEEEKIEEDISIISSNSPNDEQQQAVVVQEEAIKKDDEEKEDEKQRPPLYKSNRFKGYLTLSLTAAVNYKEAYVSINRLPDILATTTLTEDQRPTDENRNTALVLSMGSIIISTLIVLVHLFSIEWTKKMFKPKLELILILFLVLWWAVGLALETKFDGIAGDGKNQYNLYFSVWFCFIITAWTLERWLVSCDYLSLAKSLASWPFRAPGWIAIFFFSLLSLISLLDLFLGKYKNSIQELYNGNLKNTVDDEDDNKSYQWGLLFYTIPVTIVPAIFFILVELFRPASTKRQKPDWETIMEGIILVILVVSWIPTVIVATTPGGIASDVGNCYFFLWSTAVFVMDTSIWWINDRRKRALLLLYKEQLKYHTIQQRVLEQSNQHNDDSPPIPELVLRT